MLLKEVLQIHLGLKLTHLGDPGNKENNIWLIGKGITFDSGGLSLKSSLGMIEMKSDMSGGAAVITAMEAISKLNPKINVIGTVFSNRKYA